jgi:uncharacterized membrane protein YphA (DoxX/SURF4 family)
MDSGSPNNVPTQPQVNIALLLIRIASGLVFDITKGGIEYALTQLLIALALLVTGAGAYSLGSQLPGRSRKL